MSYHAYIIPADINEPCYETDISVYTDIYDHVPRPFDVIEKDLGPYTLSIYVEDEGRLNNSPMNPRASGLADQIIVGNVMVAGPADDEGETLDIPDRVLEVLKDAAAAVARLQHQAAAPSN